VRELGEDLEAFAVRAGAQSRPVDVLARARIQNRRTRRRRRLVASAAVAVACVATGVGLVSSRSGETNQLLVTHTSGSQIPGEASPTTVEAPLFATTADYVRAGELPSLFYFGSHTDRGFASDSSGNQVSVPLTGCGSCPLITFEGGVFTNGDGDTQGKVRRIDLRTLSENSVADSGIVASLFPGGDGHSIWIIKGIGNGSQAWRIDLTNLAAEAPVELPEDRVVRNVTGRYFVLTAPRVRRSAFELWDPTTGDTRILADDANYLDSAITPDGDTLVAWHSTACFDVIGCDLRITNVERGVTTTVPLPQSRYGILGAMFSPTTKQLAVLSSLTIGVVNNVTISPDGELVMVDVASGSTKAIDKASGGIQGPPSFQWSADGDWLIVAGLKTMIHRLGTPDAATLAIDGYRYAFRPER